MPTDRLHHRKGSALILVLWCLIFLGMVVFGVVEMVELSVNSTAHHEMLMEARALASSGVALGSSPQLLKDDPLLSQSLAPGRQFQVTIQSEGARLNLNYILLSGHRDVLVNLFTQWGLSIADADHVADCLYDWISPGALRSADGAKGDDYAQAGLPQRPTGQPFGSFDEVESVMGMDLVTKARSNWKDSFTLWSSGPLNVNEAPADLIGALFGVDPRLAENLVAVRNGKDGIAGTLDDVPLAGGQILQSDLGIDDLKMTALNDQISFSDNIRRVESVGQADRVRVKISVVTRLNSSPIQYLSWTEQ